MTTQDQLTMKVCLIEDIMKAKRFLWAQGLTQHDEFIKEETATALFDELYDLDILPLEIINDSYGKQINEIIHAKLMVI